MKLFSPAFEDHAFIPVQYTGDGWNHSPPLRWSEVPLGTRELVLLCEDPDAPGREPFAHWIIYGLSPLLTHIPDRIPRTPIVKSPVEARQGVNSFGETGYGGPLPPVGHGTHRYVFRLLALSRETGLPPAATRDELLQAIRATEPEAVLAEARLTGMYARVEHLRMAGGWRP